MAAVATLDSVAEKIAPGRTPAYTSAQVLKAMELISESSIGRQQLADKLGIGEGSTRTIVKRLTIEGLISTTRGGMALTAEGRRLLDEIHNIVIGSEIKQSGITVGTHDYAVIVRRASHSIKNGIEQRDSALLAGAKGATTLVYDGERFMVPGVEVSAKEDLGAELSTTFKPEKGDVLIIGSADDPIAAEIGAKASALELLRN